MKQFINWIVPSIHTPAQLLPLVYIVMVLFFSIGTDIKLGLIISSILFIPYVLLGLLETKLNKYTSRKEDWKDFLNELTEEEINALFQELELSKC